MILLRRLAPAIPWIPWVPVLVIVGLLGWSTTGLQPDFAGRQLYLRAGLLVAALGLSFAFDDPAAPTTDPVPSPLRRRRLLRLALSILPWTLAVAILLWAGAQGGLDPVLMASPEAAMLQLPIGRLVLEASTMAVWGLAIAGFIASRWDEEPGKIASAALLGLYAVSWMVPERWKPWALPNDVQWITSRPWWWVAFGLGVLLLIGLSWDTRSVSTRRFFHLGADSSLLAPWRSASRTTKPTSSPASSQRPPGSR